MYLISGKRDNTYAVLDTSDGIAEYYTKEQVLTLKQNGVDIAGVTPDGRVFILDVNLAYLWYAQKGTPLKIKLTKDLFWRQALYIDCIVTPQGKLGFRFFDRSGLFCLTSEFIIRSKVAFNFNTNDPELVAKLIADMKGSL